MKNLLIVESPHKAKTISQWLDKNKWIVFATAGHIKNLPKNDYGIDKNLNGKWIIIPEKKELLNNLLKQIKISNEIYIGTDDDREGERIAFDLVEYFKLSQYYRVIFNEVTKKSILNAIKNAISYNKDKINAQIARRTIDRIIGYPISSAIRFYFKKNQLLSQEKIKKIGIGRITAPALGIIARREREIQCFIAEKYKNIYVSYFYDGITFSVTNHIKYKEENKEKLIEMLNIIKKEEHIVKEVIKDEKHISPPTPLTTAKLIRKMNYLYDLDPKEIMKILQTLYEGVKINDDYIGLITYPRTDSYNLDDEFVEDLIEYLFRHYKEDYINNIKRDFKNKRTAQEAHEAIRPTKLLHPNNIKQYLSKDEFRIYEYIFYRTLATQFKNCVYDEVRIIIDIGGNNFDVKSLKLSFNGWREILAKFEEEEYNYYDIEVPKEIEVDENLFPLDINIAEKEEKTPPRFGIGRLITMLENNGIARPSTISDIVPNLVSKNYIKIERNMIIPTTFGLRIYDFLENYLDWLIDLEHTLKFEQKLDLIEKGELNYLELVKEYEELKNDFCNRIGYSIEQSDKIPEWLINSAKEYLEKYPNAKIDFNNKEELYKIYKRNLEFKQIAKCPFCKRNYFYEFDNVFKCKDYECKKFISKDKIKDFFEKFDIKLSNLDIKLFVGKLLKYKKVYVENLYSKTKEKYFNAFVTFKENNQFINFALEFPKVEIKKIDEKYIMDLRR